MLSFLSLLVITLGLTNVFWYLLIRPTVIAQLNDAQTQLGNHAALRIEEFLNAKVRNAIVHSQTVAVLTENLNFTQFELQVFFLQDRDLRRVTIMDENGQEVIERTLFDQTSPEELEDRSSSPSFVFAASRFGKEYISDVTFPSHDDPRVIIAVPITLPRQFHQLTQLSTTGPGEFLRTEELYGVLEVEVSLSNLLDEVKQLSQVHTGTLYIVSNQGKLIAHPDPAVELGSDFTQFLSVQDHMGTLTSQEHSDEAREFVNEQGITVIGTHVHVPKTTWGIIVQQPVVVALGALNQIGGFGLFFFGIGLVLASVVAFIFSKRLTDPLHHLIENVRLVGEGKFRTVLDIKTGDEVGELAENFNNMARKLDKSQTTLQRDRDVIAAERNKLSTILAAMSDGVIALDADRNIVLVNASAEKILGTQESKLLGQPIGDVLLLYNKKEQRMVTPEHFIPQNVEDKFVGLNLQLSFKQTTAEYISMVVSKIPSGESVNVMYMITIHDVTVENDLEQMKLDFVSMAAHELRTPLTTVRGYLSILQQQVAPQKLNDEERSFLSRAVVSAANLNTLIENLLSVSRIEKGEMRMQLRPLQLENTVLKVTQELEQLADSKNITLKYIPPPETLPEVIADKFRIEEVLRNLIGNAINYTQKGTITITMEEVQSGVQTRIIDTGPGIPAKAVTHLFTKFFRVEGELQSGSKGTGLGLFISKQIVDAHHGKIEVETKLGKGSIFSFTLPTT